MWKSPTAAPASLQLVHTFLKGMGEDAPEVALNLQQGGKGLPSGVTPQPPILPRSCPLHYLVKPPDLEAEGAGAWTAFSSPFLPPMLTQPRWTTLKAHCGVFCGPVPLSEGLVFLFATQPLHIYFVSCSWELCFNCSLPPLLFGSGVIEV